MLNECLLIFFILLQIADGALTYRVLQRGGREMNPLLAKIFDRVGVLPGLIIGKGFTIGCGGAIYLFAGAYAVYSLGVLIAIYAWVVGHNYRQL